MQCSVGYGFSLQAQFNMHLHLGTWALIQYSNRTFFLKIRVSVRCDLIHLYLLDLGMQNTIF